MPHSYGEKIRIIRLIRGYNEHYMASKLKITQQAYSYLERVQKNISEEQLLCINKILDIPKDFLERFNPDILMENIQHDHIWRESGMTYSQLFANDSNETIRLLTELIRWQDDAIRHLRKMHETGIDRGGAKNQ